MIGDRAKATTHAATKPEVIARIIVKTRNVSVSRAHTHTYIHTRARARNADILAL